MAKTKKLTPKQQEQLDKVMDYVGSLGYDFNNAQEMEEAFISKEVKKSGSLT
ncbi:hypothetical protein [Vibrio sp. Vb0301]|uniref:hypothetical protein n=1 Tax=Vibrio sp. Vb0301 TaxID=3074622 RepID=UPI0029650D0D|nr:hypothetical protein [Vibrio sp. Vb0301]MDW2011456.1 hypothetical protein [Vibrio sp. Vb0301]